MKYLSAVAFVAALGLSSAIALPEPIHITIDVQIPDDGHVNGKEQQMRPDDHAGSFTVSRPQEVVGLDDPIFHGTYPIFPMISMKAPLLTLRRQLLVLLRGNTAVERKVVLSAAGKITAMVSRLDVVM